MENTKNMVRWTDEERALLAHFVRIAEKENGLSASEGCDFAAKKLGRSAQACRYQYYSVIKAKGLANDAVLTELTETNTEKQEEKEYFTTVEELLNTIEELNNKLKKSEENQEKLLKFIDRCMDDLNFKVYVTLADTGRITQDDIRYNTALISRMIHHNLENLE
jgi:flagellar motility protein MotE (MotC chaperone)